MAITKINTPGIFDLGSANTSVQLPSGNTASRPTSPSAGEWRYNTDDNKVEYYDGSDWFQVDDEALPLPANFPGLNFNTNTYVGTGATQTIDAKFNEAAVFNGSSSGITSSSLGTALNVSSLSFSLWFKTNLNDSTDRILISSYDGSGNARFYASLLNSGLSVVIYGSSSTYIQNFINTVTTGTWYHLSVTHTGTTTTVYLNGTAITPSSTTGSPVAIKIAGSPQPLTMGQLQGSIGTYAFKGSIDQVRIYNTALTGTQVTNLYNNETTTTAGVLNFPTGAGCIAAYQLDGDASDVGGTYGGVPTDIGYTGLQFEPDFVWIKQRNITQNHRLFDSIRGATKILASNLTDAEGTNSQTLTSFNSNGFSLGNNVAVNTNNGTYVSWCWKAGGTAVSNTDGSDTSLVSANQNAGFSIVSLSKTDLNTRTYGHGLNSVPEMIILKRTASADDWYVYQKDLGNTVRISLNSSAAKVTGTGVWGSTTPTDSVFTLQNQSGGAHIAYCFTSITGYQKIGSYTGNGGSNMIETGFEPAFVMLKNVDNPSYGFWVIIDNKRSPENPRHAELFPNSNDQEYSLNRNVNFLSNGFELTSSAYANRSSENYIYLAIAADAQPAPVLADSFQPVIYTGNRPNTQSITGVSFKPDLVWIKNRNSGAYPNVLTDSVRGNTKYLQSDSSQAELTTATGITSFDSNGFSLGADGYFNGGASGANNEMVAWCWKAGGIPTINTEGSITSLTNANPAAGFSIVKFNSTPAADSTIGHGLNAAPDLIIAKRYDSTGNWAVQAPIVSNGYLLLNSTQALNTTDTSIWNATAPTSSVFTAAGGSGTFFNAGSFIAYCFTSITGYQKIGTYTSQYPSTTSINVGFQPRFVMIKSYNQARNWVMHDSARGANEQLYANLANAEGNIGTDFQFTSTGFNVSGGGNDLDGGPLYSYIYLAIA